MAALSQSSGRPVCQQTEHLLPALVLVGGRRPPTGCGRISPPVAGHALVCVSPDPSPPACAEQNNGGGQRIAVSGTPLAQSAMGCGSEQNVSATVLGAASSERPPITGTRHDLASPAGAVAAVAPERSRLLASGLSDSVVATIQSAEVAQF